jgi:NADH dehydrogenase
LAASAVAQLRELGVEVLTEKRATSIDRDGVLLGDERIRCSVIVWAAGVAANGLTKTLAAPRDRSGCVLVNRDMSVPGYPNAFVIGDAARVYGKDGKPLPGVSPVAMQEARAVATSIRRARTGETAVVFEYVDKGSMATIGRSRAIAMVGRLHLKGFVAWLAWLLVHIWYLIGFKNRVIVMINWAWSYVTYKRGARIIAAYGASEIGAQPRRDPAHPMKEGNEYEFVDGTAPHA